MPTLVKNEDPVIGIILELKGDAKGFMLLLLSKQTAKFLIKLVIGESDVTKGFDEMETICFKRIGKYHGGHIY